MILYRTLENVSSEDLHQAFLEAFSDYQVNMDLSFEKFEQMLQRRGYRSEISLGAFKDGRLVGFVFNGLRNWNGKKTAYDTGTGVIAESRRQGITSNMLFHIKKLLVEKQIEQYLLEVIITNESAFHLYQKQGFKIQREFSCFQLTKEKYIPITAFQVERVHQINLEPLKDFWDFEPSWQNSIESINVNPDAFHYFVARLEEKIVGYGIIDKKTGDIPQIAVSKNHRKKGIGSSILTEMIKSTNSEKISILNVEKTMEKFLTKMGFEYSVGQYEMLLEF